MQEDTKRLVIELKDKLKIFGLLEDDEFERLIPYFEKVSLPAGTVFFNEGDPADSVGFVISGSFEVRKETEFKGKQIVLAVVTRGSIVGEFSFLDRQPRTATVVAREDSELLVLERDALEGFFSRYPETGVKLLKGIIRIMSLRYNKTVERLAVIF